MLLSAITAWATHPPDPGELATYQRNGSYGRRLEYVRQMGNDRVRPDVARRTLARLRRLAGEATPAGEATLATLLPRWEGMPTKGTNKVLVLLVDFPDYPHVNEASLIASKLFGDGVLSEYPKESLRNYYRRASYGQLELGGNALGWYRMQHERSWYTTTYGQGNAANRAVMEEVVRHFDATHNFAQYDNNGDGKVDYFAVIWSGPDTGWGNFWWGYQWRLQDPITADGVQFETFSWQWESRPVGGVFEAETVIHETGHALGLPDYYDYTPDAGPAGGVGGLDMMHGNYADHNAFSKFMLEWLTPRAIASGQSEVTLRALAQYPDAAAIMPGYTGTPYAEYFMVENRQRVRNDQDNPANGLLIWHIDARPNAKGDDFLYNNSDTAHKLLRLMEADGLEEIENGDGKADAGDYYNEGDTFSPASTPPSRAYDGSDTRVTVQNISPDGVSMTASFAIGTEGTGRQITCTPDRLQQTVAEGITAASQTFQVAASGGTVGYALSKDAPWITVTPASGSSSGSAVTHTVAYDTAGLPPGVHEATITLTAPEANNSPQTVRVTLTVMGTNIGRAVDAANLTWTTGGTGPWFEQTTVTHDGQDAAQSGPLGDLQTNWIQTTVTGPGTLSFNWRVSSEADYDFLLFLVDGQIQPERLSGFTDWQPVSLALPGGVHTLRWAYAKDPAVSANADAAWVDEVGFVPDTLAPVLACAPPSLAQVASLGQNATAQILEIWNEGGGAMDYTVAANASWVTVSPARETSNGAHNQHTVTYLTSELPAGTYEADLTVAGLGAIGSPRTVHVTLTVRAGAASLAEAVDSSGVWIAGGDAPWAPQAAVAHDGQDAAASGTVEAYQQSWVETTVQGPGTLSFWWKVSSEAEFDYLMLWLDGVHTGLEISGEWDWRQESVFVPTGAHTVRWLYEKDGSVSEGADAGWLDQVHFSSTGGGTVALLRADFNNGLPAGWEVLTYSGTHVHWRFDDPGSRGNLTGGSAGFAIADSDAADLEPLDADLLSPPFDCTGVTNVLLEFQTDLRIGSGEEIADVDVQVNGQWFNLWRRSLEMPGPQRVAVPLGPAAGQPGVRISFHYYNALYDWWWQVDDVTVTATAMAAPVQGFLAEWRKAWEDFDRNYALFSHKGIQWGPVYEAYTNAFAHVTNATQFALQLSSALQSLQDWEVAVRNPAGAWLGYAGVHTPNHPSSLFTAYTGGVPYEDVRNAHVIYHAWVASNLAHVVVATLDRSAWTPISNADLDAIFSRYQNAGGMILDLRTNPGGAESNAVRLASRFTSVPRTYGYTRTRISGSDHDAFTPFAARTLVPSAGRAFDRPVACLIGQTCVNSAEWLALMLQACPGVTLVGDRTRGSTGNSAEFTIPSLNVSYLVSREVGYTAAQIPIENVGVLPDLALPPGPGSFDEGAQRDYVLERAIDLLRPAKLTISRLPAANAVALSWPAVPWSQYTLLRATNLVAPVWTLAPGWTSNRVGVAGTMSYTNAQPGRPIEYYRLRFTN